MTEPNRLAAPRRRKRGHAAAASRVLAASATLGLAGVMAAGAHHARFAAVIRAVPAPRSVLASVVTPAPASPAQPRRAVSLAPPRVVAAPPTPPVTKSHAS